jgi:hypothetical protein
MTATVMLLKYKEIIVALIAVFGAVLPYLLSEEQGIEPKNCGAKTRGIHQFSEELH